MTPWQTGTQVGPYVLELLIGTGGMGEVWRARDNRLNRIVAIKRLRGDHGARFQQEARAIASLNHPNICQIYDVGPDYLVLEHVDGQPLQGPFPFEDAVRIAREIADALDEAHAHGVLHRDLKPANILVTPKGSVKLLDFGLAKCLSCSPDDMTRTVAGTVVGTPAYMSPEQAQALALDERSDIFSYGVVLYEMVSGQRAFRGGSVLDVLNAVVGKEPEPITVGQPMAGVIARCLRKSPEERFRSMADILAAFTTTSTATAEVAAPVVPPSIAVLPFANMSADPENEYFSDGLAEEIINLLARVPGMRVIARTSAFAFKGQNTDIRRIAETLGVAHVLEGSVRKSGNRIRVMAQLISAADGSHVWSERFDRELCDVFEVQDEIARTIATSLHCKLNSSIAPRVHVPPPAAYELYLKGRYWTQRLNPEALAKGRQYYSEAVEIDPEFALAHYALGEFYFALASFGVQAAANVIPLARMHAQKALDVDPDLPEAQALMGLIAASYDFDWSTAARWFQLAVSREPVPAWVRSHYGSYMLWLGRYDESMRQKDIVIEADPLNLYFIFTRAAQLVVQGRFDEGRREFEKALELDAKYMPALFWIAMDELRCGNRDEALRFAQATYDVTWQEPLVTGFLAGLSRDAKQAEELIALISADGYSSAIGLATYHMVRGETDASMTQMLNAVEQRHPGIVTYLHWPFWAPLKSHSLWRVLAAKMNLAATTQVA